MKWFACYVILNGEDFLDYALDEMCKFILRGNGKIIIIEGADKHHHWGTSPVGLSTDKTVDIIHKYMNITPPGTIIHRQVGWVDGAGQKNMRQMCFDTIAAMPKDEQPDWIIIADDDELWHHEKLNALNDYIEANPYLNYIYTVLHLFVIDYAHYAIVDWNNMKQKAKQEGRFPFHYDVAGNEVMDNEVITRQIKWRPGIRYGRDISFLLDENGDELYNHPRYVKQRILFDAPIYHYTVLREVQNIINRVKYYMIWNNESYNYDENILKYYVENNPYFMYLAGRSPKFTGFQPYHQIKPYPLENHPSAIKRHPCFYEDKFMVRKMLDHVKTNNGNIYK